MATCTFASLAVDANADTVAGQHEKELWSLASILFDDVTESLPPVSTVDGIDLLNGQLRKRKLSEFWSTIVERDVETAANFARSPEEKAVVYLTGGNIFDACAALLTGTNFHLAQLVAQLPGDKAFRETISKQIDTWRKRNDWSEMTDAVRTIYEILAGQTTEVHGVSGTGSENKASTFKISDRFHLDWKRAFGIRLWYGTLGTDNIAEAVKLYAKELEQKREPKAPLPWFIISNEDNGWTDPQPNGREDALWGILKIYADQIAMESGNDTTQLVDWKTVASPKNVSGDPIDARLSFQLINALQACPSVQTDDRVVIEVSDDYALTYATALDSQVHFKSGLLVLTCWALLHLSDEDDRSTRIRDTLDTHAGIIEPDSEECTTLISTESDGLHIPYEWVCAALAKHAELVEKDYATQARWLIEGNELMQAHEVFCRTIGPDAIISLDYNSMREVLGGLMETDISRKVDWDTGAGLYYDFIELVDLEGSTSKSVEHKTRVNALIQKLAASLEAVSSEVIGEERSRTEKIAIKLMAEHVGEIARREHVSISTSTLSAIKLTDLFSHWRMSVSLVFHSLRADT
jgi:nuclear pore complex protein Nup98-Nup96